MPRIWSSWMSTLSHPRALHQATTVLVSSGMVVGPGKAVALDAAAPMGGGGGGASSWTISSNKSWTGKVSFVSLTYMW
jgi:hypothetical protein